MYPVKIVAVVVDKNNLTLYTETGDTLIIPQGDHRIRNLVAKVVPVCAKGGIYTLTAEEMEGKNHYANAERELGGVVRFFRVLKAKAKEIFDKFAGPVEPMKAGEIPDTSALADRVPVGGDSSAQDAVVTKSMAAAQEIIDNSVGTSSPDFQKKSEDHTLVAVLEDGTCIPGAEKLDTQMHALAEKMGSKKGVINFFNRLAQVKRNHSIQDLLTFMEKGELPIADDGSVLVYKRLNETSVKGVFTDVYSGSVKQRVGSFVHMAESMVDPNRSRDCSNGLHVARRDYLNNFSGDVCVLAKLAPEDVIAVPQYDARKLRAKGYHIIAQLSAQDARNVCSNRPLEDTELLGNAMAGNHVGILEFVEITKSMGGGLKITPAEGAESAPEVVSKPELKAQSLDKLPDSKTVPTTVDARAVAIGVAGTKTTNPNGSVSELVDNGDGSLGVLTTGIPVGEPVLFDPTAVVPIPAPEIVAKSEPLETAVDRVTDGLKDQVVETAEAMVNKKKSVLETLLGDWLVASTDAEKHSAADALIHHKTSSKKSWSALGVPVGTVDAVTQFKKTVVQTPPAKPVEKAPVKKKVKAKTSVKVAPKAKPVAKPAVAAEPVIRPPKGAAPKKRGLKEEAQHLWDLYQKNPDVTNARALLAHKQKSKKSWTVLGLTDAIGKRMTERVK